MHQFWILSVLGLRIHNNRVGMSKNLPICFKYWEWQIIYLWSRTEVDRIYLVINLVVSLFPKCHTNIGKPSKPKNPKPVYCIAYCIAYCPLLFPVWDNSILLALIGPCGYSHFSEYWPQSSKHLCEDEDRSPPESFHPLRHYKRHHHPMKYQ